MWNECFTQHVSRMPGCRFGLDSNGLHLTDFEKDCEKIEQQVLYVIAMNYIEDVKKVKEKQIQFSQGVINLDPQL